MRAICKATAKKVRTRAFADSIGVVVVGGGFVDDGVEGADGGVDGSGGKSG